MWHSKPSPTCLPTPRRKTSLPPPSPPAPPRPCHYHRSRRLTMITMVVPSPPASSLSPLPAILSPRLPSPPHHPTPSGHCGGHHWPATSHGGGLHWHCRRSVVAGSRGGRQQSCIFLFSFFFKGRGAMCHYFMDQVSMGKTQLGA